jgi:SAM-dependent methyltransferase
MAISACRVCGQAFFEKPLLRYEDMPKAAQQFPDAASVETETGADLTVCQCSGCGLVQLSNDPVPYYREVIRAAAGSEVVMAFKTRQFADLVEKHCLRRKRIIEIGCGRGEFLSLLRTLEIDAYGLEYSDASVAQCAAQGLNVFKGYVESASDVLAQGPFDAFLLLMFLEHMPAPNAALRGIHHNLADGSVGLVEVPNFDMVLQKKLFSEFIGDHLLYFTEETLRTTLHINGFEILECRQSRDDYVLSAVVRKRQRLDIADFHDYQTQIKNDLDQYLNRFPRKKVAIWGAGHQALAVIALTRIAASIRYVVDGAPFKQGKYTPSTHLPIVAPDTLRSDPVDAVIVMAASYSDEVAGILREKFDRNIDVAILRDFGLESVSRQTTLRDDR